MTSLEGRPLSAGDSGYQRIRADIIFGVLTPSGRLKLDAMKEDYGLSVSTLREILNRLTSEGFVVAEGQRGFEVAPISAAEFQEIAELRELLEGHMIEKSFAAGDLDWEAHIVSAHHKLAAMERMLLSGERSDAESWKQCDFQFHRALVAACGSKVLLDAHAAVYDRYLRYQMIAVVFRGEMAAAEHRELKELALKRDAKGANKVLHTHIHDCVTHALRNSDWLKPVATKDARAEPRKKAKAG